MSATSLFIVTSIAEISRLFAMASAVKRPLFRAFRLPVGAPGEGPPCIRHLPFAIAGAWHGVPLRVRAPQRFARCISTIVANEMTHTVVLVPRVENKFGA